MPAAAVIPAHWIAQSCLDWNGPSKLICVVLYVSCYVLLIVNCLSHVGLRSRAWIGIGLPSAFCRLEFGLPMVICFKTYDLHPRYRYESALHGIGIGHPIRIFTHAYVIGLELELAWDWNRLSQSTLDWY